MSKSLPYNLEAEQAVIGGCMMDPQKLPSVSTLVSAADFYRLANRRMWEAMSALSADRTPIDPVTVGEWLESRDAMDDVGGAGYIAEIVHNTPSAANVESYARIVKDHSLQRQVIEVGDRICRLGGSGADRLESATKLLDQLVSGQPSSDSLQPLHAASSRFLDELSELADSETGFRGFPTGIQALDNRLGEGLIGGRMYLIAARPKMGKTVLAQQIATNIAADGHMAVIFSLEMDRTELYRRAVSSVGGIKNTALKDASHARDYGFCHVVTNIARDINKLPILVDDSPTLTMAAVRNKCLWANSRRRIGTVVIDYLQLLRSEIRSGTRDEKVSQISRDIKALAKELDVPVIALSQLNRNLEQRPDKRPIMSDLRESGSLEQDSDVILFLYRDDWYHPGEQGNENAAEIIIGAHRHGRSGERAIVKFNGAEYRFDPWDREKVYQPHTGAKTRKRSTPSYGEVVRSMRVGE